MSRSHPEKEILKNPPFGRDAQQEKDSSQREAKRKREREIENPGEEAAKSFY